jgi:hypothetical protein
MNCAERRRMAARACLFPMECFLILVGLMATAHSLQVSSTASTAGADSNRDHDAPNQAPASSPQASPTPQGAQASTAASTMVAMNCPHPADPHRRRTGCKDVDFDWDETLTNDLNGIRSALRRLGISPALSYTGALQTNVAGGPH